MMLTSPGETIQPLLSVRLISEITKFGDNILFFFTKIKFVFCSFHKSRVSFTNSTILKNVKSKQLCDQFICADSLW